MRGPWFNYWRLVWREKPKAKAFALWRAAPAVLIATIQFFMFRANRPIKEMWIIIAIIVGVYMALYCLETVWNFTSIAPPLIDEQKTVKIGELERHALMLAENMKAVSAWGDAAETARQECEKKLAAHPVIQLEQRQLDLVRAKLHDVTADERHVLQFILDHGKIRRSTIERECRVYRPRIIDNALSKATQTDLVIQESIPMVADRNLSINPALELALKIVLSEKLS